ncbi:MAG: zf-HC2 domain-containing protein [Steroidobacteraceae bacterium]
MTAGNPIARPVDDCELAFERMPWSLNGTLPELEARELDRHLQRCGACRERLERERVLHAAIQQPLGNVAQSPLAGWSRFEERLAASTAPVPASSPTPAPDPAPARARVPEPASAPTPARSVGPRRSLRLTLLVQAAAIGALAVALLLLVQSRAPAPADGAAYRTVSAADPTLALAGAAWRVTLAPTIARGEAERLLDARGLRVAAGPSASNVYTVTARAGTTPDVLGLRGDARVLLLEPLPRPPGAPP